MTNPVAATPEVELYRPSATKSCSEPLYRFVKTYDEIIGFFFLTILMATKIDHSAKIANDALRKIDGKPAQRMDAGAFRRVQDYREILSRNLVTEMANNFLCYLSEIIQIVVRRKTDVLKSAERLTTEEILQFSRLSELTAYIADRKINELSYGGLRGMADFISDRLGLGLFEKKDQETLLTILVELRNIHTHNRGVVNDLFLQRVKQAKHPQFQFQANKKYHVNFDEFTLLSRNAVDLAIALDEKVCTKFKIKRHRYKRRLSKDKKPAAAAKSTDNSTSSPT